MEVYSNIGGRQHGLVVITTNDALLTNNRFVCQVYKGNLVTPIAATRHTQE